MFKRIWLSLILSLLPAVAAAQPISQDAAKHDNAVGEIEKRQNDFLHRPSAFVFPRSLAGIPAAKTTTFGPNDAAVTYSSANAAPWLTVYVYPASIPLAEEAKGIEEAIRSNKDVSTIKAPSSVISPAEAVDGWFQMTLQGAKMTTGYRVVKSGNWFIKARVTVPEAAGGSGLEQALQALQAVPWAWTSAKTLTQSRSQERPAEARSDRRVAALSL